MRLLRLPVMWLKQDQPKSSWGNTQPIGCYVWLDFVPKVQIPWTFTSGQSPIILKELNNMMQSVELEGTDIDDLAARLQPFHNFYDQVLAQHCEADRSTWSNHGKSQFVNSGPPIPEGYCRNRTPYGWLIHEEEALTVLWGQTDPIMPLYNI